MYATLLCFSDATSIGSRTFIVCSIMGPWVVVFML